MSIPYSYHIPFWIHIIFAGSLRKFYGPWLHTAWGGSSPQPQRPRQRRLEKQFWHPCWHGVIHLIFTYTKHTYIYIHLFILVIIFMRHHGINMSVWSVHFSFKKSMSFTTISGILYVAYVCHLCVRCLRACGHSTCKIKSILLKKFKIKAFHEYNREIGQTNKDSEQ